MYAKLSKDQIYKDERFNIIEEKPWFMTNWQIIIIAISTIVVALINSVPTWYVVDITEHEQTSQLAFVTARPLISNIWYSSLALFITISVASFLALYIEISKFTGKYSSAIFVLVPSFIWLFQEISTSDSSGSLNLISMIEMIQLMNSIIFWTILSLASFLLLMKLVVWGLTVRANTMTNLIKLEFVFSFASKITTALIDVAIIMMLANSLTYYGIFSLDLASELNEMGQKEYVKNSDSMLTYIGIISIIFGSLLLFIGMTKTLIRYWKEPLTNFTKIRRVSKLDSYRYDQPTKEFLLRNSRAIQNDKKARWGNYE